MSIASICGWTYEIFRMWLVFTLYALFASVFTVEKVGVAYASPFFFVGSRMALAGIIMLGYAAIRNPKSLRLNRQSLYRILLLGFFNIYLTNVLELWGIKYLTSFKTCFIYSLSPFLTALLSYIILNDVMTLRKWAGLLTGFLGLWPILANQSQNELATGTLWGLSGAEIAVLGAVISSVLGWIFLRQLVHDSNCSPVIANGYSMVFGGTLATLHSGIVESWAPLPVADYTVWIECTLFMILISNIICYNLYGSLLKRFSPTFMAFSGLSTPLFTALFGWIFHGEVIDLWFFASLSIVFFGLLIFYFEEIKTKDLAPVVAANSSEVSSNVIPSSSN
jgi:drug/metabolite transporter (DMT)-like permease